MPSRIWPYVGECVLTDILKNTSTFIFKNQKSLRISSLIRDNNNRLILKKNECYIKNKVIIMYKKWSYVSEAAEK